MYTREQWARGVLAHLGNPHPEEIVVAWLVVWTVFETGPRNGAAFNLLNTIQEAPGSTFFNHITPTEGVQNFTSFEQGVAVNADVIRNGRYPRICEGLSTNSISMLENPAVIDPELEVWGTGPRTAEMVKLLGSHEADSFEGELPQPVPPPVRQPDSNIYTVKHGDTLWGIAEQQHTTVAHLLDLNLAHLDQVAHRYGHLRGSEGGTWIFPGEVIKLA